MVIVRDPADAVAASDPAAWAIGQLEEALSAAAADARVVVGGSGPGEVRVLLARAGATLPDRPESLAVASVDGSVVAAGSDVRGLLYAVLELADRVRCAPTGGALAALHVMQKLDRGRRGDR